MAATLHVLHPNSNPLAGYLRLGHTGHRKLADLHAAGRFPYSRIVVDASHFIEQKELVKALKASGCEVVLDPNFAEMATPGRFGSSALRRLPWANLDRPWEASDFGRNRNLNIAKALAEFVVAAGVDAVLAPTHLIESSGDSWWPIDLHLCEALRIELDRLGALEIAVDYQLITTGTILKEGEVRTAFALDLMDLPIENIWLRTSGFGATATGAGTRQFIESVRGLHMLNKPLIADHVGGFAGLSTLAFGAVAGMSHGVGQKEGFKASDWRKVPSSRGGTSMRAYVPELDRYFKEDQLQAIYEARGKSRFGCSDTSCCQGGSDDMIEASHAHFLTQRHRQIDDLSRVPETRRIEQFLLRYLDPAIRSARYGAKLKIADEKVMAAVNAAKVRLVRLRDALADLDGVAQPFTRAPSPTFRGGAKGFSAVLSG